MKELELKYGCNPNQKPSRIFMDGGQGASHYCSKRQTGVHQFHGCPQWLAACKGAQKKPPGLRPPLPLSMCRLQVPQWACLWMIH